MKKIISGCVFFYTNSLTPYKAAAASQKTLLALGRAILLLWCLVNVTSAQQNNKPVYNVDIPAQPLIESLHALSTQTETLFLFPYRLVEQRQGNAVKGQLTTQQALDRLLQGSGLHGVPTSEGVMTIFDSKSHSKNRLGDQDMKTRKHLLASTIAFFIGGNATSVIGQEAGSGQETEGGFVLEEIVVTATSEKRVCRIRR